LVKSDQEFAKIGYGDSTDIEYSRAGFNQRWSKSVLLKQPKKAEVQHHVDIKVSGNHLSSQSVIPFPDQIGSFDILKEVSITTPGLFYYMLSRRNVCDIFRIILIR